MSLLLLFHPRSGSGPAPAATRYDGRRPQPEGEDEELAVVLAAFRQLVGAETEGEW